MYTQKKIDTLATHRNTIHNIIKSSISSIYPTITKTPTYAIHASGSPSSPQRATNHFPVVQSPSLSLAPWTAPCLSSFSRFMTVSASSPESREEQHMSANERLRETHTSSISNYKTFWYAKLAY